MRHTFVVRCFDGLSRAEIRQSLYEDHKSYLSLDANITTLVSGPILDPIEGHSIGSFFLVEATHISDVEAFNKQDPFSIGGVWDRVEISLVDIRVDNRGSG